MKRRALRKVILLMSLLIFPITLNYFSPYLVIRGSWEGVLTGSGLLFLSLFFTALLFGRAFCGWLCPAGSLGDICAGIQNKPTKRRLNMVKYLLWIPWIGAIVFGFIHAGGLRHINILYFIDGGISVNAPFGYIVYFLVIGLILVLSFAFGRRTFCHSICWMAPFLVLGSALGDKLRIPAMRLYAEPSRCNGCRACTRACPMSLDVSEMVRKNDMRSSECILCASCADTCPKKVLQVRFGRKLPADVSETGAEEQVS